MPPYKPVTSKAESRKLFSLAEQGKLSMADAKGKTRAADWPKLPEHVKAAGHPARNLGAHLHPKGGNPAITHASFTTVRRHAKGGR